jgi:predicted RNA-binding Zn-ribbon protein involved in translation (DUF1610 family)
MELVSLHIVASCGAVLAVYAPLATHGGTKNGDAGNSDRQSLQPN